MSTTHPATPGVNAHSQGKRIIDLRNLESINGICMKLGKQVPHGNLNLSEKV